jgi:chromosomal replication initiation ATPase DnaA
VSQIALPLAWPPAPADDAFLVTPSNAAAARLLDRWATWPVRTALISGPRRSGRTLLARIFAAKTGAAVIDGTEHVAEVDLFHAWNAAQGGRPLLLIADTPWSDWAISLPDLRSRLAATPFARIEAPDDQLVRALLERLFDRRGVDARPDLLDWLAARIERSHLAIERTVDLLDQDAMERRRRLTIPLARATLVQAGLLPGAMEEP